MSLMQKLAVIGIISFFSSVSIASTDLGDVVTCPGARPQARFLFQSVGSSSDTVHLNYSFEDILKKVAVLNSEYAFDLELQKTEDFKQMRWVRSAFTNSDGEVMGACKLEQLHRLGKDLNGQRVVFVNEELYRKLSLTEQSIFTLEIIYLVKGQNFTPTQEDVFQFLKWQFSLAIDRNLNSEAWLKVLPRSWSLCAVPLKINSALVCLGPDFDTQNLSGAIYPHKSYSKITIHKQNVSWDQAWLLKGDIQKLFLNRNLVEDFLWFGDSRVFPSIIEFTSGFNLDKLHISDRRTSTVHCPFQRLTFRGGDNLIFNKEGCLMGSPLLQNYYGEVYSLNGQWQMLPSNFAFDERGVLL
ncbi:MAG: hypothetical protein ACLGGX_03925 [Bdellovibrionia bacterium]